MVEKTKTIAKKGEKKNKASKKKEQKEGLFTKIGNFFSGVKTEWKRVKWPSKKDVVKYSIATIVFIISCALFFYLIDIILAFLHTLGN